MPFNTYRIESLYPITGPLWSAFNTTSSEYFADRALAVVIAAKSVTTPSGHEIRVVHVPSGEIVYRKTAFDHPACSDELAVA